MKTKKTILVASSSMLAAGMAQGAITYTQVNQQIGTGDSGFYFDLNGDSSQDFRVFFDANNASKPCVLGTQGAINPTPYVLNELIMNPSNTDNNGIPVIPFGTTLTSQVTVDTNTVSIGTDQHGKNEGYLYQNGENNLVGQWPINQDTIGYVALAMVNTNVTPATTNYGWLHLELNGFNTSSPVITVIDYAYENTAGVNILAGQTSYADPQIYQAPTNQTVAAGVSVNMSVQALGLSSTPTYRWMAGAVGSGVYTNLPNTGIFSGANSANLTISSVAPANQLDYVVVVTDSSGSVTSSPPATLSVNGAALIGPIPAQQMIYAGYPAQFSVINVGGVTTTNQWQKDGTNLLNLGAFSGVTSPNLLISNVTPATVGNYLAVASTTYLSVTSSVAPLGIVYPDGTLYESNVLAYGAVDYYRLGETSGNVAYDFVGGKNGAYGSTSVLGQSGPNSTVGFPGFVGTNYAATFQFIDPSNTLPLLPWNFNTNAVTITAWIYPQFNQGNGGIVFTTGTNNLTCGIRYDGGFLNSNGVDGNIGYSWGNNPADFLWNSGITAPHNQWSMVALAISPTDATLYIINSNGVQSAVNTVNHTNQLFNATEYIGTYPLEGPIGNNNFNGNIDEVAVFNSTLSQKQISTLYASALGQVPLTISRVGGNNLQLQWTGGVLQQANSILGPWTTNAAASSPYIVSPTQAQQFFRAR